MDKSALRRFLPKPIVTQAWGGGKLWGSLWAECWGLGFEKQLILCGAKTFVCTGVCVGWNLGQSGRESSI